MKKEGHERRKQNGNYLCTVLLVAIKIMILVEREREREASRDLKRDKNGVVIK